MKGQIKGRNHRVYQALINRSQIWEQFKLIPEENIEVREPKKMYKVNECASILWGKGKEYVPSHQHLKVISSFLWVDKEQVKSILFLCA